MKYHHQDLFQSTAATKYLQKYYYYLLNYIIIDLLFI